MPAPGKKITKAKRARGVAQVVGHLSGMLKALSSNINTTTKKNIPVSFPLSTLTQL
jgi:hypothetical protein